MMYIENEFILSSSSRLKYYIRNVAGISSDELEESVTFTSFVHADFFEKVYPRY